MLPAAIGISSLAYLWAAVRQVRWVTVVLKPGTMALIIALAAVRLYGAPSVYGWAVLIGLLFSVVGDVALLWADRWFLAGLGAFFVAHVWYIGGLSAGVPVGLEAWHLVPAVGMLGVAGFMVSRLVPALRERGKPGLIGPVLAYITVISVMVWRAASVAAVLPWAAAGAVLFCFSDSVLAWDRFVRPLPLRDILVMAPYFAAQVCFALSVGRPF